MQLTKKHTFKISEKQKETLILLHDKYKQKYNYDEIFIPEHITRKYDVKDPYAFRKKFGEKEFIKLTKHLVYE